MQQLLLEYESVFNNIIDHFTLSIFQGILCVLITYFGLVYSALV